MADTFDVAECREKNANSIRNTHTGKWLERACAEVERLKAGDFTADEFQNLCHKMDATRFAEFCDGCDAYQRSLFGHSRNDSLRKEIERLKAELDRRPMPITLKSKDD